MIPVGISLFYRAKSSLSDVEGLLNNTGTVLVLHGFPTSSFDFHLVRFVLYVQILIHVGIRTNASLDVIHKRSILFSNFAP